MPTVGTVARRSRTVSRRDIEELARGSRFGGLIVQGGVTTGLLNAVVAEELPGPGSVFLRTAWNFLAPVRPGDDITAEVEVLEVHATKPIARIRTTITDGDGVVVVDGDAHVYRVPL
jgi:acyl dehydratase